MMVQIFLVPGLAFAAKSESEAGAPLDLCALMMATMVDVLPSHVRERTARSFPPHTELHLLTLSSFKDLAVFNPIERSDGWFIRTLYGPQIVRKTDDLGLEVLRRSKVNSAARREVVTVAQVDAGHLTHFGDFAEGSHALIVETSVEDEIERFEKKLGARPAGYVRLVHSHPEYDVRAPALDLSRTKELSDLDIDLGRRLSKKLDVPLVVEAVSPNGYTYAAVFFKGVNVTDYPSAHNPLAEPNRHDSNVTVKYIDAMPPPSKVVAPSPPKPENLPAWLRTAYEDYKRTSVLPNDAYLRTYLLRLDAAHGGAR